MNLSTARLTGAVGEELRLQNELIYVFREIDVSLRDGQKADPYDDPSGNYVGIQITKPDGSTVIYRFYSATRQLSKGPDPNPVVISQNVLVPIVSADLDHDSDVDSDDSSRFSACLGLPASSTGCQDKDFDGSGTSTF